MNSRDRQLAAYVLVAAFWVVALAGVALAVADSVRTPSSLPTVLAFLIMTGVFTYLSIPTAKGELSVAALVTFLSICVLGPWPAVGIKVIGTLGVALVRRSLIFRSLRAVVLNTGMWAATAFLAAMGYVLAGGRVVNSGFTVWLVPPFVVMAVAYTPVNLFIYALLKALLDGQSLPRVFMDRLQRLWINALIFALVGVVGEALYAQLHLLGLLVVFALMLAVRFTFQLYAETQRFRSEMAGVLAEVLAFKDPYTGEHSARVAELAVRIAREMGFDELQQEKLRDSALLHDIGKVAVPDAVLVKPGPLDEGEWKAMERHVDVGGDLLQHSPHLRELAGLVRAHHTEFDTEEGRHAAAAALPLEARIITVADAFDAMTSDRPYRKALPEAEAVRRLLANSGRQFDPTVVQALLRTMGPPSPSDLGGRPA